MSLFERWGDAGGYGPCLLDGKLSVREVAQVNPGGNTPRREST